MTLDQKIQLVNDLVAENPDTTIKDYLEIIGEIENIKPVTPITKIIEPVLVFRGPGKRRPVYQSKYVATAKVHW